MQWQSVPLEKSYAESATLNKQGITLSGKFMENQNLSEYEWVEIFVDDNLQCIGLKFSKDQTPNETRKLVKSGKKGKGRRITAKKLSKSKWIADVLKDSISDRRFSIEKDDSIKEPNAGVQYYISVGYRFKPKREFAKIGDYPELAGVYRLFKDGEVVRIGESDNLKIRLKEHFNNYKDAVNEYDFAEIQDVSARKNEEKLLLEKFRVAHSRLPKLNPVAK